MTAIDRGSQNVLSFDRAIIEKLRTIKNSAPLFIVGCPRSGTTLLLRLIRDYLDMGFGRDNGRFVRYRNLLEHYGALEQDENLTRLLRGIFADGDFRKRFKGFSLEPEQVMTALEERTFSDLIRLIYAAFALAQGKSRWGGKTPRYVFHIAELSEMFPDAKFIHIVRDGRDVALSLFGMPWGAPRNCYMVAKYWQERVSAAQASGADLGAEKYLEIKYERLLTDPVSVFQKIVDFGSFEVDRDQVLGRFGEDMPAILKKDNLDKWKTRLTPTQIMVFEQTAGAKLEELGYEVQNRHLIGRPIGRDREVYYRLHNLLGRIVKEGASSMVERLGRGFEKATLQLRSLLNSP